MPMDRNSSNVIAAATDNGDLNSIEDAAFEATHQNRSRCCFQEWMQIQRHDLTQLIQSLHIPNEDQIETLIEGCVMHYEDYVRTRMQLAEEDASTFFAPTWCTSLENSLLWVAGCRPSIFIRLLYALSGHEVDARLGEWLEGARRRGVVNLRVGDLSPNQMERVDALHRRTLREEEKLTREMASCQEELADQPIAVIANQMEVETVANEEVETVANEEAEAALREHQTLMRGVMKEADELRLSTLKGVIQILSPVQTVEFLVASKKLHLSLHQWGKRRDERHGRRCY